MDRAMRTVKLTKDNAREGMTQLKHIIIEALHDGDTEVVVRRPSKSRDQERHYHALINEIAQQVKVYTSYYPAEVWKALLVDQFRVEREQMGEPLRKSGQTVPAMDGSGRLITIRPSTRDFSVSEASAFIEFLYAQGVEMGVKWTATIDQILQAERAGRGS